MNKKSTFKSIANNYLIHPKSRNGITLVALVVTIIVLLILAGVAITMVLGDNSVLKIAKKSAGYSNIETAKEQVSLAYNAALVDYKVNKSDSSKSSNDKNLAILFAKEIKEKVVPSGEKYSKCIITYNEEGIDEQGVIITYNEESNKTYSAHGSLVTTEGSEELIWTGLSSEGEIGSEETNNNEQIEANGDFEFSAMEDSNGELNVRVAINPTSYSKYGITGTSVEWQKTRTGTYGFEEYAGYSGDYSGNGVIWASNNGGVDSSEAESEWTVSTNAETEYTIKYRVSSESEYDKFSLSLDGNTIIDQESGDISETDKTITLSAGNHTLVAQYVKDSSAEDGLDLAYIILEAVGSVQGLDNYTVKIGTSENNCNTLGKTGITVSEKGLLYAKIENNSGSTLSSTQIRVCELSYDANGGSGTMKSKLFLAGNEVTIGHNIFTSDEYLFLNWNTNSNGSGITYVQGQREALNGDVKMYAQWGDDIQLLAANGMTVVNNPTNPNLVNNNNIRLVVKGSNTEEIPIPKGAFYIGGTESTGFVLKYNNSEFVWIPIPINNNLAPKGTNKRMAKLSTGSYAGTTGGLTNYEGVLYDFIDESTEEVSGNERVEEMSSYGQNTSSNREPAYLSSNHEETQSGLSQEEFQLEYNKMIDSVKKYGGFYVGRYESSYNSSTDKIQSIKGVKALVGEELGHLTWYGLYDYHKNYSSESDSLMSSMIWGSQYDAVMNWALSNTDNYNKLWRTLINSISETSSGDICGSAPEDRINNIFDLEGNVYELTQEALGSGYRAYRGRANNNYDVVAAFERAYIYPECYIYGNDHFWFNMNCHGSRLALYIK